MATAVCHRQEVGTWQSIFPADQLTEQKSAFFVKKLLAVSVSYLTYLRNIFPGNPGLFVIIFHILFVKSIQHKILGLSRGTTSLNTY